MVEKVAIVHPGEMGISVAMSAHNSGNIVYWASEGRSPQTQERAQRFALIDTYSLEKLCQTCSILVSVCPPHAAEEVAAQVLAHSFQGLYVDANAISPQRVTRISELLRGHGVAFVDGGIIGGPAWEANTTWLYLSGREAGRVAHCFSAGPLQTNVLGETIGQASALKMCYAAYTKGTTALLCAILAAAEELGVREELEHQWSQDGSAMAAQTTQRVTRVTAKAWRFVGEMEEIAATFEEAGMPGGFHEAAADIYRRLAHFKHFPATPLLPEVLDALRHSGRKDSPA